MKVTSKLMRNTLGVYPIELFLLLPEKKKLIIVLINYLIRSLLQRNILMQAALTTRLDLIEDYRLNNPLILHTKQTQKE